MSFIKLVQAVKYLKNSISRARLNFQSRPILCTTLYRNFIQASNFGGTFDHAPFPLNFLFMKFLEKMPPYIFYTRVQKKSKMTKNSNQGGPAFISLVPPLTSTKSGYSFRKNPTLSPLQKKSATLNSFLPCAIISRNALPAAAEVQSSNMLLTFKNRLRAHLSL